MNPEDIVSITVLPNPDTSVRDPLPSVFPEELWNLVREVESSDYAEKFVIIKQGISEGNAPLFSVLCDNGWYEWKSCAFDGLVWLLNNGSVLKFPQYKSAEEWIGLACRTSEERQREDFKVDFRKEKITILKIFYQIQPEKEAKDIVLDQPHIFAAREQYEADLRERARVRESALAKLTPEERKILGLI